MGSLLCCGCLFHHAFHPPFPPPPPPLTILDGVTTTHQRDSLASSMWHVKWAPSWSVTIQVNGWVYIPFTLKIVVDKVRKNCFVLFFLKKRPPNSTLTVHLTRGRCWVGLVLNCLATALSNRRTYTAVSALSPLPTFVLTSARNHDDVIMIALPPRQKKKQKNRCG